MVVSDQTIIILVRACHFLESVRKIYCLGLVTNHILNENDDNPYLPLVGQCECLLDLMFKLHPFLWSPYSSHIPQTSKQWNPRECKKLNIDTHNIIMISRNNLIMMRNVMLIFIDSSNIPNNILTTSEIDTRLHENVITKYDVNMHNRKPVGDKRIKKQLNLPLSTISGMVNLRFFTKNEVLKNKFFDLVDPTGCQSEDDF